MVLLNVLFVFSVLVSSYGLYEDKWGYHGSKGPENWAKMYPKDCAGKSQSPIEFSSQQTEYRSFDPLVIRNLFPAQRVQMYLKNNGHTLMAQLNGSEEISGAGLGNTYLADSFHFHWGSNDAVGSEHLIDGRQYPAELHIVHYNVDRFTSVEQAMTQPKGLAVLGFFFEIVGNKPNAVFQELVDLIKHVPYEGNTTRFATPFDVKSLFPKSLDQYFRYDGSLTTPDCHESVVWTVFNEPIKISQDQVQAFRNVYASRDNNLPGAVRLVDNHRPVQPINDRVVYRSFASSASYVYMNTFYLVITFIVTAFQKV